MSSQSTRLPEKEERAFYCGECGQGVGSSATRCANCHLNFNGSGRFQRFDGEAPLIARAVETSSGTAERVAREQGMSGGTPLGLGALHQTLRDLPVELQITSSHAAFHAVGLG